MTPVALAMLGLLVVDSSCTTQDGGGPAPPPTAFIWIDSPSSKVDASSIELRGEAECVGCPQATGWQYMQCPAIDCPSASSMDITWSNDADGASGRAAHGITSSCDCPVFANGYCYAACDHSWSATIPLGFGSNTLTVSASGPGYATGTKVTHVQRVPQPPAWVSTEPATGEVMLAWTAVGGATSYDLHWSTTPYAYSSLCTRIPGVSSPYRHRGVESGATYYYFVTALSGDAESFDSPRVAVIAQ